MAGKLFKLVRLKYILFCLFLTVWAAARFNYPCKAGAASSLSLFRPSSRLPLTRQCTRRDKHNVNEHINVVSPFLPVQFFHAARSTAATECRTVRENHGNSRPNGDWIADKVALFSRFQTHGSPVFCDRWKSSIVDNFAFNKWPPLKSERYRLAEKEYFGFCDR